ncbi:MAG: alpha-hydroxy-acid oxidizing protein [Sphingomonadales bacterium]|nr:alpha-hydroxy-acid oxidizing protein [Sphingomonadales bacterium]
MKSGDALNIDDLAAAARRRLPRGLHAFVTRGAEDEVTLRENRASIDRVLLRQRVGVDVAQRDISTTVFGQKLAMPLGIAVTGLACLLRHDGERKLARAAAAAGVPFTIGSSNFTAQADLLPIAGSLLWRQLYPLASDRLFQHQIGLSRDLGITVLQVTMDSPVIGNREYIRRSGWMPGALHAGTLLDMVRAPHWLFGTLLPYLLSGGLPEIGDMPAGERKFWGGTHEFAQASPQFDWEALATLRRQWDGVLVAKGISTAQDARRAAACGVDGVIVSNHGGRSLDGAVGSFAALPEVVDAVAPKVTVIVDGGFRRGSDVVKALAMGAGMVMVGRATLLALAAFGEPGVARALAIFRDEIDRTLALVGARSIAELGRDRLADRQGNPLRTASS